MVTVIFPISSHLIVAAADAGILELLLILLVLLIVLLLFLFLFADSAAAPAFHFVEMTFSLVHIRRHSVQVILHALVEDERN